MERLMRLLVVSLSLLLVCVFMATPTRACSSVDGGGSWFSSSTWVNCTGTNGLPGVQDSVTITNGTVTIDVGLSVVQVTEVLVSNYALLINKGTSTQWDPPPCRVESSKENLCSPYGRVVAGSLITGLLAAIQDGAIESYGSLNVTANASSSYATVVVGNNGRLYHEGDLYVGAQDLSGTPEQQ